MLGARARAGPVENLDRDQVARRARSARSHPPVRGDDPAHVRAVPLIVLGAARAAWSRRAVRATTRPGGEVQKHCSAIRLSWMSGCRVSTPVSSTATTTPVPGDSAPARRRPASAPRSRRSPRRREDRRRPAARRVVAAASSARRGSLPRPAPQWPRTDASPRNPRRGAHRARFCSLRPSRHATQGDQRDGGLPQRHDHPHPGPLFQRVGNLRPHLRRPRGVAARAARPPAPPPSIWTMAL